MAKLICSLLFVSKSNRDEFIHIQEQEDRNNVNALKLIPNMCKSILLMFISPNSIFLINLFYNPNLLFDELVRQS